MNNEQCTFFSCCPIYRGQLRRCTLSRQINKKWTERKRGATELGHKIKGCLRYSSQEINCFPTKLNKGLAEGSFKIISRFNSDKKVAVKLTKIQRSKSQMHFLNHDTLKSHPGRHVRVHSHSCTISLCLYEFYLLNLSIHLRANIQYSITVHHSINLVV